MKTAKQEAIEKAYGEHWDKVKDFVDENGWVDNEKCNHFEQYGIYENYIHVQSQGEWDSYKIVKWRLPDLNGIGTNNGWIRIESEEDLPKEEGEYNIITIKGQHIGTANFTGTELSKQIWLNAYTHFRVIENIKRPIY